MNTTYLSYLSDAEWECLQQYLPSDPSRGRPRTHALREIFDAIFYILRTGCAWRYVSCNFPPWQTVFYHFRRLSKDYERKVQTSETLIQVAMIRLLLARLGRSASSIPK